MAERREYVEFNNLKFCKVDILGQGNDTHSTVFKGLFENRDVAVKRIPKQHWSFLLNPNRQQHGNYDTHENIARYYMTEEDEDFYYIVMELCAGKLRDLVKGTYTGPPVGSGKEILIQIARAVDYLTGLNLINRNINPDTILISLPDDNMPPKIKLVDFSLSRKLGLGQTEIELSNVFQDHGMNDWTAPELLRNERNYTAAVDVFSAGCVFAYVLSGGKHPFGQKAAFRHANIATGNLQMPAEITDPLAIDLIQKMLTFDPSKRIKIQQVHTVIFINPNQGVKTP